MNNKKLIAMLTLLCFMFTLMPVAAFAEDDAGTPATPTRTEALDLTAQNIPSAENEGWAWDSASKTLTLNGLNLVTEATPAITVPADTTIILADGSENSIATTASAGIGILCNGNLAMKTEEGAAADGKLIIKAETAGTSTQGIALVDPPADNTVAFSFSNVIIDITARRGIQMLLDSGDKNIKRVYSMELDGVDYTFKNNANVSYYRSLQVWVDDNGDATLTLKNSTVNGKGVIMCSGIVEANTNIVDSVVTITDTLDTQNAAKCIMTVDNSNINALQLYVKAKSGEGTLSKLDVTDSEIVAGPLNTTYAVIEVGVNASETAEAIIKNSKIIAVSTKHSAISVSRKTVGSETTEEARGTLTMENCEFLAMGVKDFTHAEVDNHQHGNHITCVVYPSGTTVETVGGNLNVTVPANNDTVINSGGVVYTVNNATLTVNTNDNDDIENGTLTIPAGTELGIDGMDITISSEDNMIFEPGHVVTMPGVVETTVKIGNETVVIKPAADTPLYIDPNGVIDIPAGAKVTVGSEEYGPVEQDSYIVKENGNLVFKGAKAPSATTPDKAVINAVYGEEITLSVKVAEVKTKSTTPAQEMVGFYYENTELGRVPVNYTENTELVYDTGKGGIPVADSNVITVKYGGGFYLLESDTEITVNLSDKIRNGETATINGVVITGPATVDADENGKVVVTVNTGGKIGTAVVPEGVEVTVPADKLDEVTTTGENAIVLPEGSTIISNGTTVAVVNGNVTVKADGSIIVPDNSEIKIGNTIITGPASVGADGNVTVDAGGKIGTAVIPDGVKVTVSGSMLSEVKTNNEGAITLPAGSTVDKNGEVKELVYGGSIAADGTVTENAAPAKPNTGSGGFSGTYNYPVSLGTVDGAKVTFSDNNAVAGETVTITVTPDSGKQVDEVIVTDADGDVITVTKVGDNQYSFTMPAGKVNVAVTTKAISYNNKIVLQIGNQNIVVDGKATRNDVAPVIQGDRTLVPIRVIVEALGGDVDWNEATRTVTITIDGKVLTLVIDEMIPGFGQGATIMDSRTYVPIRYVAEYIGANVEWIEATQQIVILK